MKVEFRDKDDNILDISNSTQKLYEEPSSNAFKTNTKTLDRFATDGSYETGDATIQDRNGNVGLTVIAQNDRNYRIQTNKIANFFNPNQRPFYIVDTDNELRQKISYKGIDPKYKHGQEMRLVASDIQYIAIDPFFESLDEIVETFTNVAPEDTITIDITDTDTLSPNYQVPVFGSYPIIEITALSSNNDFALTNETNDETIRIMDSSFLTGMVITINSEDGTIKNDDVVNSRILAAGRPFKLESGSNTILYQSPNAANVDITVRYRRRYLF